MLAVFNASGELLKLTPSQVNQGSNKANKLYVIMPISPTVVMQARFRLPNGKFIKPISVPVAPETGYLGFKDADGNQLYMWELDILSALTTYAGNVLVQFFTQSDNAQQTIATFSFEFEVLQGVPPIDVGEINSYEAITQALESIGIAVTNNVNNLQDQIDGLNAQKQNKVDASLTTDSKEVVGAINELKQDIEGIKDVGGSGTIVTVDGQAVSFFDADTKLDVDVFNAVMDQAEILTVDEKTYTYNEQVTANGESVLNRSKVQVQKVEGDTISSTNLLSFPYYSGGLGPHERQGVTFDVQEDGSIRAYGTATGNDASFIIARNDNQTRFSFLQDGISYRIGGSSGTGVNTTLQGLNTTLQEVITIAVASDSITRNLFADNVYSYFINVPNGTTVDTIFYPYINCSLGGFDKPLGGELVNASFGGIECKARENLIYVNTEGSTENNGITWTWNKDGSLRVTGTSNSNGSTRVFSTLGFKVEGEKYSVGKSSNSVYAYLKTAQGSLTTIFSSNNSDLSLDGYTEYGFYVPANTTVNTVVYPYITKGAITGYPPMSNKGVKSTWNLHKTSLPLGTTLDFATQKKTNTYAEYTFKGDTSELWTKGGSAPTGYERWYTDGSVNNIIQTVTSSAIFKDLIICDRYPSVLSQTEYDSWNKGIAVLKNTSANINFLVPTTIADTITKDLIRQLTKGMTVRYPTTPTNTDWYTTEDFTANEINAGDNYEAYYEGTETILANDGAEEGAKPTVTAEYVIVNKIGG